MEDNVPSEEQQRIIDAICVRGRNVITDAVAGSGKTTTVLFIAKQVRVIQLTYNRALCDEVKAKMRASHVNAQVFTYHGLAHRMYGGLGHDDTLLHHALESDISICSELDLFRSDVLVIDEMQDASPLRLRFMRKYLCDTYVHHGLPLPVMLVLGDKHQCLYGYQDSDARFLTLFDELMDDLYVDGFERMRLSTSFRLTPCIAAFVNDCVLGTKRIIGGNTSSGEKRVSFIYGNVFNVEYHSDIASLIDFLVRSDDALAAIEDPDKRENAIAQRAEFHKYMRDKGKTIVDYGIEESDLGKYKPRDVFVLAPTIKTCTVTRLSEQLARIGIVAYHSTDDEKAVGDTDVYDAVTFSSFHGAKGRERAIVFVLNFDAYMYTIFDWSRDTCPDPLYVGLTRAKHQLFVCGRYKNQIVPFLQCSSYEQLKDSHKNIVHWNALSADANSKRDDIHFEFKERNTVSATDFLKRLSENAYVTLQRIINDIFVQTARPCRRARLPTKARMSTGARYRKPEEVADINGIAIPALFEARKMHTTWVERMYSNLIESTKCHDRDSFESEEMMLFDPGNARERAFAMCYQPIVKPHIEQHVHGARSDLRRMLAIASIVNAAESGCYPRLAQTTNYAWLDPYSIDSYVDALDAKVIALSGDDCQFDFEYGMRMDATRDDTCDDEYEQEPTNTYTVAGRIDMITYPANAHMKSPANARLWELKCTGELTGMHKLQLAIYAYMYAIKFKNNRNVDKQRYMDNTRATLYNIVTGETWEMRPGSFSQLTQLTDVLCDDYVRTTIDGLSDDEFVFAMRSVLGVGSMRAA